MFNLLMSVNLLWSQWCSSQCEASHREVSRAQPLEVTDGWFVLPGCSVLNLKTLVFVWLRAEVCLLEHTSLLSEGLVLVTNKKH